MSKLRNHTVYILLSIYSLFTITSCSIGSSKTKDRTEKAMALPVLTVDTATALTVKTYLGSIEGKENVEIRPQVEGILEEIYVDEGDFVKEGQKLFKINQQPYREQLNDAIATENVAKAKLQNAKLEVERLRPLVENEVISEVRLQIAVSDHEVAKANLSQASASVARARINLEFTEIKAPVSGYIGRIPKRVGNLLVKNDAQPMTVLSDIHDVYVYFAMSESDFLYFTKQANPEDSLTVGNGKESKHLIPYVSLILADGEEYPEKGVVDAVTGQVNRTTGAISLRATFPNQKNILRSGNTGTLKVQERHSGVLLVPQVATTDIQDKTFVYVLSDGNRVKRQVIRVTGKSGSNYIVEEGVNPGDRIVLTGFDKLTEGTEVQPLLKTYAQI